MFLSQRKRIRSFRSFTATPALREALLTAILSSSASGAMYLQAHQPTISEAESPPVSASATSITPRSCFNSSRSEDKDQGESVCCSILATAGASVSPIVLIKTNGVVAWVKWPGGVFRMLLLIHSPDFLLFCYQTVGVRANKANAIKAFPR